MSVRVLCLLAAFAPCVALAQPAGSPWPMERQDRWGTGRALSGPDPSSLVRPWRARILSPDLIVSHGPAFVSAGEGYYGDWVAKTLYKFDPATGATLGMLIAPNPVLSTPAVSNNGALFVHAPRNLPTDPPGRLLCVNPATMQTDWTFETSAERVNERESASAIVGPGGDAVIGSTSGVAWRLNAVTGVPVWTRLGLQTCYRTAAFTRDDTKVIFSNGTQVTALNWSDGTVAWNRDLGATAGAPASAPNGTIVVGSAGSAVYGLNPANGSVLWTHPTSSGVRPAAAFSPDGAVAYVCCDDRRMYAIRVSDGAQLWAYIATHEMRAAPAVGFGGRIYCFDIAGNIYCVSPSGQGIWHEHAHGDGLGPVTIDPLGQVYFGFQNAGPGGCWVANQLPVAIRPESFAIQTGTYVSGSVFDLFESDDQRVAAHVGSVLVEDEPYVTMSVKALSPAPGLWKLTLTVEASCSQEVPQLIYLRNYGENRFEVVSQQTATFQDSTATYVSVRQFGNDPSRFVHPETKEMECVIIWGTNAADLEVWMCQTDMVKWVLEPMFEHH